MSDSNLFFIENEYGKVWYFKNDEEMLKQVSANLIFEQYYVINYLSNIVKSSGLILDIGAHCGSHTVLYKSLNPSAVIHAFEPQIELFKILKRNVEENGLSDVYVHNEAVGHYVGEAFLNDYSVDGSNAYSPLEYGSDKVMNLAGVQIGDGGQSVWMVTVDSLNLSACDFIKIDVEGFEPHVLSGAAETIRKFSPVISFEFNDKRSNDSTASSFQMLHVFGYSCANISGDNWIATRI